MDRALGALLAGRTFCWSAACARPTRGSMAHMQGVPSQFSSQRDAAEFRLAAHRPGVELYRAHIVRHAFEPHTHDGFGLGAFA